MNTEQYEQKMREILLNQENLKTQAFAQDIGGKSTFQADPNIIQQQLSLGEELETIDYLIRSYSLVYNDKTKKNEWVKPIEEDQIILSDYGVHYFREKIAGYINKNTLLSNYDEDTILTKMYDIASTINDDIFNLYEKIFYLPTLERCKKELEQEIKDKLTIRKTALELLGFKYIEQTERTEILKEMEYELEEKVLKIRRKLFKAKLKRFSSLLRLIQDTIHSAYLRALQGQERRSLRQHMTITETSGGFMPVVPEKKGLLNKLGIGK